MAATYDAIPRKVRFEWISESWQLYAARWGTWLPTALVYLIITVGIQLSVEYQLGMFDGVKAAIVASRMQAAGHPMAPPVVKPPDLETNLIAYAVSYVLSAFFAGGLMRMAIRELRGEPISLAGLFGGGGIFLPILILSLILSIPIMCLVLWDTALIAKLGIIVTIALWCAVGLVSLIAFALLWPAIGPIADGDGLGAALGRSLRAMKQDWLMAVLYTLVFGVLFCLSLVPCYLGLLITVPMLYLSGALCYRDMIGMPGVPMGGDGGAVYYSYPGEAAPGVPPGAPQTSPPGE